MGHRAQQSTEVSRILIVDDHPTVCEGLGHRIAAQPEMTVCGQAADVNEALTKVDTLGPDLVIVDIALRSSDGLDLVKALRTRKRVPALVHSMYDEAVYADRCLHAGAMGYVNKEADPDEVIKAIRVILSGHVYLSPAMTSRVLGRTVASADSMAGPIESLTDRQLEIFRLIGNGYSAQQIAKRLHLSVHTVETHRENIKRKLNVNNVSQLTRRAVLWAAENS